MQLVSMDVNASSSNSQPHAGSGSQIRSRVTVVCAECKRLKLKCDRRTPCSSCLKRDTVPRCTYSAAAAEKIDVQSLHNRVLVLEAQIAQLTAGKAKPASHDLDHALLAVGSSGSSVLVPLDDVAGIWLEHLDLGRDSGIDLQPASFGPSCDPESHDRKDHTRPEASPCSHGDSAHSSPHPAPTATSFSSPLPFPYLHPYTRSVTPALLALLPSAQQRPMLLDVLGSVLRMHPSFNFPHFCARVHAMFNDGRCQEEIGIGPSRADHAEKPTLSFFAAATAGFALAVQCSQNVAETPPLHASQNSPSSPSPCSMPSVSSLLTLSGRVLDLIEDTLPYDMDYLHTLILRCLCMLHDGMPRVTQTVFATVGKMVNVARLMGLARDPDEFTCGSTAKYSLWEAEMRRRMWWDVFYYDLFISDCMGFPPLISDDQHTCRMPADVDEDSFLPKSAVLPLPEEHLGASNFSYFVQKCKLAQLVKNMKKRVSHDPPSSSNQPTLAPSDPSLDVANQAESEIQQYLLDLPQAFKLDIDAAPTDASYTPSSTLPPSPTSERPPPYLMIQRCELVSTAHQLVLRLFHPFLRRSNVRPHDNAMTASVNASHAIIHASRVAQAVWRQHGDVDSNEHMSSGAYQIPSSHGVFYPFARQLFHATVVAAHVVIQAPQSVVAKVALEDVRIGLDLLRDPNIATGRGRGPSRGGIEGYPSEAVTIVETMLKKAENAKRNNFSAMTGIKRKHEDLDDNIAKGFWLPYVGTGVAIDSPSCGPNGSSAPIVTAMNEHVHGSPRTKLTENPFPPETPSHPPPLQHRNSTASISGRESNKERKYPTIGIRTRVTAGFGSDLKSPGETCSRRDSSVSMSQQPQPSDTGNYGRPASTSGPTATIMSETVPNSTGEFSLSAPYGMEDRHMVDMNVSPTTSRFPPQSQAPPAQSYPSHSFSSPSTSQLQTSQQQQQQQQHMYDSGSYGSEPGGQSHPTSYYVPYPPPPVPPPTSAFRSMTSHGQPHCQPHPHSQQHVPQQAQHLDMIGLHQGQSAMDTSDMRHVAKQEEGTDRHDAQPHPPGSSFTGPEAWNNSGVARFTGQTTWNSGYSY